jgi:hypothetical protein
LVLIQPDYFACATLGISWWAIFQINPASFWAMATHQLGVLACLSERLVMEAVYWSQFASKNYAL